MNKEGGEEECRPHAQQEALKNISPLAYTTGGDISKYAVLLYWEQLRMHVWSLCEAVSSLCVLFGSKILYQKKRKRKSTCPKAICDTHLKPKVGFRNNTTFVKTIQHLSKLYFL